MILDFQEMTPDAAEALTPLLVKRGGCGRLCDYTPGVLSMWRDIFHIRFALKEEMLFLRFADDAYDYYAYPLAEDEDMALELIKEHARTVGDALRFCMVPEEKLSRLLFHFADGEVSFDRDWCDYLYETKALVELAGKAYGGQRNHIHRFVRTYGEPVFLPLTAENAGEALDFLAVYNKKSEGTDASAEEASAVRRLLAEDGFSTQTGGILYADGKAVGFTLGEILGDTLYVHVEKADASLPGVYQTLVNSFVRANSTVPYVNREEDCGVEGLRRSKLSYHPTALLKKYKVLVPAWQK